MENIKREKEVQCKKKKTLQKDMSDNAEELPTVATTQPEPSPIASKRC